MERVSIFLLLIFPTLFFISETNQPACLIDEKKAFGKEVKLTFVHSIYGSEVTVVYVLEKCLKPVEIRSKSEAAIAYYTSEYKKYGEFYVAKVASDCFEKVIVNDGWLVELGGFRYVTKDYSELVCYE